MARPTKTGLDYFPLDVDLSDEVEAVEAVHGNDGFAVIIKTWQALYKTEDGRLDCSGVLRRRTLAKRANISADNWEQIINTCIEAGLFNRKAWESERVLISHGVSKRLEKVSEEREAGRARASKRYAQSSSPYNSTDNHADNAASESKRKGKEEENKQQQQLRESIYSHRDNLIKLTNVTEKNFDLVAEHCIAHNRNKNIGVNPYATALAWFRREKKEQEEYVEKPLRLL